MPRESSFLYSFCDIFIRLLLRNDIGEEMKKKIIFYLLILLVVFIGLGYGVLHYPISSGMRSGKIVELKRKGYLFKTYEGTLDLGSAERLTWDFSIHDEALGEQLEALSGKYVSLEYREILFKFFYNTKFDIVGSKVVNPIGDDNASLCRLVSIITQNGSVVRFLRPLIEKQDPDLLKQMRECSKSP